MAQNNQDAYCTLLMSDHYLPGAMVLAHSLRDNGTKKSLAVLVTLDSVSKSSIDELEARNVYDHIIPVDRIVNSSPAKLSLMDRADLVSTFTKIALWRQTQFRRIIYIDADVVVLRAPDELFDLQSSFAAVPDIGWPDCFNSGVLALNPNMGDYYALLALAKRGISFDGADQGLLNMYFRNWERLSFTYNCTPSGNYQYVPAYRHFQSTINIVHYIGHSKPWLMGRDTKIASGVYEELLARWWSVYERHYRSLNTAIALEGANPSQKTVQQYVKGEPIDEDGPDSIYSSITLGVEPKQLKTNLGKSTKHDEYEKAERQYFSAPQRDWDPLSQPPPQNSRPEASNFQTQIYTMSADPTLFQAPKSYPKPPKDLWYQVPEIQKTDERPKPIFPWEENQPKPTRVFADDKPPATNPTPSVTTDDSQTEETSPTTPGIQVTSPKPFAAYTRTNAWDDVPEIERYISHLAHSRTGKVQVLMNAAQNEALSPGSEEMPQRRPSMKLTDFPTEIERPSLPVTPAPVRRPSFWGEEKETEPKLPGAEGVPKQEEWNPFTKLEELQRRQSEMLSQEPAERVEIPDRNFPESAFPLRSPPENFAHPASMAGSGVANS